MSTWVYYKFKAKKEISKIFFDGSSISIKDLREKIMLHSGLNANDTALRIERPKDATTNPKEEYKDDEIIQKFQTVLVSRIPCSKREQSRPKILNPEPLVKRDPYKSNPKDGDDVKFHEMSKVSKLYELDVSEDDKISLMMKQSTENYFPEKSSRNRGQPPGPPPITYVCHKCKMTGHYVNQCPGLKDKDGNPVDLKSLKRPTGIPQDFLIEVTKDTPGAYLTKDGRYAVPVKDRDAYAKGKKEKRPFSEEENPAYIPVERKPVDMIVCPLCRQVMKNAVFISCCGHSYCHECLTDYVFNTDVKGCGRCPNCNSPHDSAEAFVPNPVVRDMVHKYHSGATNLLSQSTSTAPSYKNDCGTSSQSSQPPQNKISNKSVDSPASINQSLPQGSSSPQQLSPKPKGSEDEESAKKKEDTSAIRGPFVAGRRVLKPKPPPEVVLTRRSETLKPEAIQANASSDMVEPAVDEGTAVQPEIEIDLGIDEVTDTFLEEKFDDIPTTAVAMCETDKQTTETRSETKSVKSSESNEKDADDGLSEKSPDSEEIGGETILVHTFDRGFGKRNQEWSSVGASTNDSGSNVVSPLESMTLSQQLPIVDPIAAVPVVSQAVGSPAIAVPPIVRSTPPTTVPPTAVQSSVGGATSIAAPVTAAYGGSLYGGVNAVYPCYMPTSTISVNTASATPMFGGIPAQPIQPVVIADPPILSEEQFNKLKHDLLAEEVKHTSRRRHRDASKSPLQSRSQPGSQSGRRYRSYSRSPHRHRPTVSKYDQKPDGKRVDALLASKLERKVGRTSSPYQKELLRGGNSPNSSRYSSSDHRRSLKQHETSRRLHRYETTLYRKHSRQIVSPSSGRDRNFDYEAKRYKYQRESSPRPMRERIHHDAKHFDYLRRRSVSPVNMPDFESRRSAKYQRESISPRPMREHAEERKRYAKYRRESLSPRPVREHSDEGKRSNKYQRESVSPDSLQERGDERKPYAKYQRESVSPSPTTEHGPEAKRYTKYQRESVSPSSIQERAPETKPYAKYQRESVSPSPTRERVAEVKRYAKYQRETVSPSPIQEHAPETKPYAKYQRESVSPSPTREHGPNTKKYAKYQRESVSPSPTREHGPNTKPYTKYQRESVSPSPTTEHGPNTKRYAKYQRESVSPSPIREHGPNTKRYAKYQLETVSPSPTREHFPNTKRYAKYQRESVSPSPTREHGPNTKRYAKYQRESVSPSPTREHGPNTKRYAKYQRETVSPSPTREHGPNTKRYAKYQRESVSPSPIRERVAETKPYAKYQRESVSPSPIRERVAEMKRYAKYQRESVSPSPIQARVAETKPYAKYQRDSISPSHTHDPGDLETGGYTKYSRKSISPVSGRDSVRVAKRYKKYSRESISSSPMGERLSESIKSKADRSRNSEHRRGDANSPSASESRLSSSRLYKEKASIYSSILSRLHPSDDHDYFAKESQVSTPQSYTSLPFDEPCRDVESESYAMKHSHSQSSLPSYHISKMAKRIERECNDKEDLRTRKSKRMTKQDKKTVEKVPVDDEWYDQTSSFLRKIGGSVDRSPKQIPSPIPSNPSSHSHSSVTDTHFPKLREGVKKSAAKYVGSDVDFDAGRRKSQDDQLKSDASSTDKHVMETIPARQKRKRERVVEELPQTDNDIPSEADLAVPVKKRKKERKEKKKDKKRKKKRRSRDEAVESSTNVRRMTLSAEETSDVGVMESGGNSPSIFIPPPSKWELELDEHTDEFEEELRQEENLRSVRIPSLISSVNYHRVSINESGRKLGY